MELRNKISGHTKWHTNCITIEIVYACIICGIFFLRLPSMEKAQWQRTQNLRMNARG